MGDTSPFWVIAEGLAWLALGFLMIFVIIIVIATLPSAFARWAVDRGIRPDFDPAPHVADLRRWLLDESGNPNEAVEIRDFWVGRGLGQGEKFIVTTLLLDDPDIRRGNGSGSSELDEIKRWAAEQDAYMVPAVSLMVSKRLWKEHNAAPLPDWNVWADNASINHAERIDMNAEQVQHIHDVSGTVTALQAGRGAKGNRQTSDSKSSSVAWNSDQTALLQEFAQALGRDRERTENELTCEMIDNLRNDAEALLTNHHAATSDPQDAPEASPASRLERFTHRVTQAAAALGGALAATSGVLTQADSVIDAAKGLGS